MFIERVLGDQAPAPRSYRDPSIEFPRIGVQYFQLLLASRREMVFVRQDVVDLPQVDTGEAIPDEKITLSRANNTSASSWISTFSPVSVRRKRR